MPAADPTDVVGRRIVAYLIDALVVVIAVFAVAVPSFQSKAITAPIGSVRCGSSNDTLLRDTDTDSDTRPQLCFEDGDEVHYLPQDAVDGFMGTVYGLSFGLQIANLVVLQGLTGASIGKLLLGLRVVRPDGRRAGIGWAALRWVLLFVDSICCILPGIVLVFVVRGHRRLGDLAASTYVVRRAQVGTPVVLPGDAPIGGYGAGGWADPAGGGTWGGGATGGWDAPSSSQGTPWAPPTGGTPSADGPTWDAARNAYIQYDRHRSAWLQWNDAVQEWRPIDQ